jgi:hypothetical protein
MKLGVEAENSMENIRSYAKLFGAILATAAAIGLVATSKT